MKPQNKNLQRAAQAAQRRSRLFLSLCSKCSFLPFLSHPFSLLLSEFIFSLVYYFSLSDRFFATGMDVDYIDNESFALRNVRRISEGSMQGMEYASTFRNVHMVM